MILIVERRDENDGRRIIVGAKPHDVSEDTALRQRGTQENQAGCLTDAHRLSFG